MRVLIAAALAAALTAPLAAEPNTPRWKQVGSWDIRIDSTLDNGCFMMTEYEGGTALRIGFDRRPDGNGYIMIGNENWKSIDVGKGYNLSLQFDLEEPWIGEATAVDFDGLPMLFLTLDDSNFFAELMRKHGLTIKYAGREVAVLGLAASTRAMKEVLACQVAMDKLAEADPFKAPPQPADPFAPRQ